MLILLAGTAALVVALMALRKLAPERTQVIVPAYTCPLVALAVAAIVLLRGITRAVARKAMGALDAWSAGVAQRRARHHTQCEQADAAHAD